MRRSTPLATLALLVAGPVAAQVQLDDALGSSTTGTQTGGQFVAGGGWQAGHQVMWDLGVVLTEGTFSVQLSNWNPNSDSPQHQFDKQHILSMYESAHGSPHQSDADVPKGSFWEVRTGASYDNCFKFLSSTSGFDPPPLGRDETRVTRPLGAIQPTQTYTLEVRWTRAGEVTVLLDGQPQVTHQHGVPLRVRYVFIGTDNAPAGTYGPQADVVYRNVRVTGTPTPDAGTPPPPDAGASADGGAVASFEPVADTWTEPANPTAVHGADADLRTGGDGRTVYFRFDVRGVGRVQRARLFLQAMNAGGGGDLHLVPDNSWSEATVSHQNRPVPAAAALASLGRVEIGGTYAFDVTPAVTGNGLYSFAITSTDVDGSGYDSRESGATGPELVVESVGPAGGGAGGGGGGGGGGSGGAGGAAGGGAAGGGAGGGGAGGGTAGGAAGEGGGGAGGGGAAGGRLHMEGGCSSVSVDVVAAPLAALLLLAAGLRRRSPGER